jgi:hypothetical protein
MLVDSEAMHKNMRAYVVDNISVRDSEAIPEKSAQQIFRAADQIIRAGRSENDPATA